jgi:hypothetical protein
MDSRTTTPGSAVDGSLMTSSKVRSRLLEELVVALVGVVDVVASVPLAEVLLFVCSPLRLVAPELNPATAPPLLLVASDSIFSSSVCLWLSMLPTRYPVAEWWQA